VTGTDIYLLSPEISICGLALVLILLDLFLERKWILAIVGATGLAVPFAFAVSLWGRDGTAFGGMLAVDNFALFFKFLFLGIVFLLFLFSTDYVSRFRRFQGEYYALVLLSATGMMFMACCRDLIPLFIALELSSISLYALVSFLKDVKSSEAGLKYLLLGAIASAVLLYGIVLVFGLTGTTRLTEIAGLIPGGRLWDSPALLMAFVLMIAGFGFKIATVPFHMWVPDVYEGAPTPITAYLSVASKAAGFAIVLLVFYTAFGTSSGLDMADWAMIFAVLSAITMTLGNVAAIVQTNIKRMLGYSSIAHAGYILLGLAAMGMAHGADNLGQSGVLFFLAAYTLANLGAFIAIIAISNKVDSDLIEDYSGMVRRAPWLAVILALCLISLIGIPPTAGFMAKVYIFSAGMHHGLAWLVVIAVINTCISAYYYLRVVKVMFLGEPASLESVPSSTPLRATLAVTALGVIFLGVYPYLVLHLAELASFLP
jgi:NADH-quinone oxidoreductase subunit N